MLSLVLKPISNLWKVRSKSRTGRHHLMLAGINQKIFINQWGHPDIQFGLDRLHGYFMPDTMVLTEEPGAEDYHSVWIYQKRNRIFFFRKGRLTSHFRWNEFKDKWKDWGRKTHDQQTKKSPSLRLMVLS